MTEEKFLESNTVSVILAVLGLVIIFFAAYKIYQVATYSEEKKNVQNILDMLKAKIDALPEGKISESTIQGFDKDWYIVGFNTDNPERPEKCSLKNCICVCKSSSAVAVSSDGEECQKNGFCRELDYYIQIQTPFFLKESIRGGPFIKIENKLFAIQIVKSKSNNKKNIDIQYVIKN